MPHLLRPTGEQLLDNHIDVTEPSMVEITTDGKTVWVNIDGVCLLRICRFTNLFINTGNDHQYHSYNSKKPKP